MVVRTNALRAFEQSIADSGKGIDRPVGTKERRTRLVVIAALCGLARIKPGDHGAATQIAHATDRLGAPSAPTQLAKFSARSRKRSVAQEVVNSYSELGFRIRPSPSRLHVYSCRANTPQEVTRHDQGGRPTRGSSGNRLPAPEAAPGDRAVFGSDALAKSEIRSVPVPREINRWGNGLGSGETYAAGWTARIVAATGHR